MQKPISSHAQTIKILTEHQLKAKKHFGQNFIIDPTVVEKIARLADVEDKVVIEVGPGLRCSYGTAL
jgi:16S rRNA (adenine1518-N6/adenine1519-N6)-dimethyltransferase